ncbi:HD domain-containing protein [Dickeya undicola]|uniref:HD domain-containing protein n=1 Tax=Dickeya undicola TaxID=1577887 RepID=UPI000532ECBA|nr:HD domain-containing protein [Dickeya undicola]
MEFEKLLNGKILDPIHGTIRVTDIEKKVIGHPLFQRLRNIKQNTFLYKVFPSAMHSRFEHSLGVMHISYNIIKNLLINSYRYDKKYNDSLLFKYLEFIPTKNIQELRLAALLHDIGHGPMSHQFDSFVLTKKLLIKYLGDSFSDIYELIEKNVEHEHISLIFIKKILLDLDIKNDVCEENILKIIDSKYNGGIIYFNHNNVEYNIQPLLTSLISSCPIDSDRMDYLLRDSYFSGVKCGIYNVERLLMSVVPVLDGAKVCLGYKESSIDSISEFIFSRASLFSQVYYHKTNRSFSAMLSKVCKKDEEKREELINRIYQLDAYEEGNSIDLLEKFYLDNSDDYFINETIPEIVEGNHHDEKIIDDIVNRKPWKKLFEFKKYNSGTITEKVNKCFTSNLHSSIKEELDKYLTENDYIIDIVTDNAFKDIEKTEIKLLIKKPDGSYHSKEIIECGDKLDFNQSIRYFTRIFINPDITLDKVAVLIDNLNSIKEITIKNHFEK